MMRGRPPMRAPAAGTRPMAAAGAVAAIVFLAACASGTGAGIGTGAERPVAHVGFDAYRSATLAHLREQRSFQLADPDAELAWNAPREWSPVPPAAGGRPRKGILLVHGLGDSPWSFHDIGPVLAAQGLLVRTVLLPGHGTRPEEMLAVTAAQWRQVVDEQAQALDRDVDGPVFIGGFSTGANLALDYAYRHPEIAGLVLFSPGFKSMPFDWLAPLVARFRPWLVSPGDGAFEQTPVRYQNMPTNGFAQFYQTSAGARRLLERPYAKPVFMAVARHDSVLDTAYLLQVFQHRFTHPDSRLIWYGEQPRTLTDQRRVLVRQDRLPAYRISQFSHMGLLFSPANALYGQDGSLRICLNGQAGPALQACRQGGPVWYSDWGYREAGKVHARLTFNPYFDWQAAVLLAMLGTAGNPAAAHGTAPGPMGGPD